MLGLDFTFTQLKSNSAVLGTQHKIIVAMLLIQEQCCRRDIQLMVMTLADNNHTNLTEKNLLSLMNFLTVLSYYIVV